MAIHRNQWTQEEVRSEADVEPISTAGSASEAVRRLEAALAYAAAQEEKEMDLEIELDLSYAFDRLERGIGIGPLYLGKY